MTIVKVSTLVPYAMVYQMSWVNMICSYAHKYLTCEISAQYLYNKSTGCASNFTLAIEAQS